MVVQRKFTLNEHVSEKNVDQNLPIKVCLCQGMKVNMTMLITGQGFVSTDGC